MQRLLSTALGTAVLLAAALTATASGRAHDITFASFTIEHPWARASAGPARNSAAFMTIRNSGGADRLLAAAGDVAGRIELHSHLMEGDVMKMRRAEAVEVPAEGAARLQPGAIHIMLIGLREPLKEGDRFPLTLTFEKAGDVTVEVAVEAIGSMGGMNHDAMPQGSIPGSN